MQFFRAVRILLLLATFTGCGYTTGNLLPSHFRTIYVEAIENKVDFTTESLRELYIPQLELRVRDQIIDRFLFDGHLRVAEDDQADLVLKGQLIAYQRDDLRLTANDDVQEFRIRVLVSLKLYDPAHDQVIWEEPSFEGSTEYFTVGSQAISESEAIERALTDLSRRVVERTIEDW